MGSRTFTKLSALVKRWPKEIFTSDKQLGDHVKKSVLQAYGSGTLSAKEEAKLETFYETCNRLVNSTHKKNYERLYPDSTSSGIERKIPPDTQINIDELAEYDGDEESRTVVGKLKNSFPFTKKPTE